MLLTRSIAIVPCVIIAILARNSLDYLDDYINVEQSLLVRMLALRGRSQANGPKDNETTRISLPHKISVLLLKTC